MIESPYYICHCGSPIDQLYHCVKHQFGHLLWYSTMPCPFLDHPLIYPIWHSCPIGPNPNPKLAFLPCLVHLVVRQHLYDLRMRMHPCGARTHYRSTRTLIHLYIPLTLTRCMTCLSLKFLVAFTVQSTTMVHQLPWNKTFVHLANKHAQSRGYYVRQ